MREITFRAMGCSMLAVIDRDDGRAGALLEAVPGWFAAWEAQLSRFRETSDLSRLNAAAGRAVRVTATLWEVLEVALRAAQESGGLVRPTVLGALEAAGYDRSFEAVGQLAGAPRAAAVADWREVELDRRAGAVRLPPGVRLDLGGVAKGWAAQQAAARLGEHGPALVDAGGDVAVSGPMRDGSGWPIGVASPLAADGQIGVLRLSGGAVATSGRDYRRWRRDGAEQHHIIDPRTGRPAQTEVLSATVVAPDGPSAEVGAKAALILGAADGLAWVEARPQLAGLLVLEDGRVLCSGRMGGYLEQMSAGAVAAGEARQL